MATTFSEMVQMRQSCRNFDETRPVEREKLERIIETARLAPSACNSQPWRITVVQRERTPDFAKCLQTMGMNKFASKCPVFLVLSEEEMNRTAKIGGRLLKQHYASYDIGILTAHLCYAAMDEGLSTCIVGWLDEKAIQKMIGLDEKKKVCLVICVGYAASEDKLRTKVRKPASEIAFYL